MAVVKWESKRGFHPNALVRTQRASIRWREVCYNPTVSCYQASKISFTSKQYYILVPVQRTRIISAKEQPIFGNQHPLRPRTPGHPFGDPFIRSGNGNFVQPVFLLKSHIWRLMVCHSALYLQAIVVITDYFVMVHPASI